MTCLPCFVTDNEESRFDSWREQNEKRLPHERKGAGAKLTHSRPRRGGGENYNTGFYRDPVIDTNRPETLQRGSVGGQGHSLYPVISDSAWFQTYGSFFPSKCSVEVERGPPIINLLCRSRSIERLKTTAS